MNKNFLKQARKFAEAYRVTKGAKFRLKDVDPRDTLDFDADGKAAAQEALTEGVELLSKLQDKLYAQDRWSVLVVFQAMDAAGRKSNAPAAMTANPITIDRW